MDIYRPTMAEVKAVVTGVLGGEWFEDVNRPYDLNLGGIRNDLEPDAEYTGEQDQVLVVSENRFNDWLYTAFMDENGEMQFELYPATVDPGIPWRIDPKRGPNGGVGAVREGFYKLVYELGMHGPREALEQKGPPFFVYRDNDRNEVLTLDPKTQEKGWGFNLHYMGDGGEYVNKWSGGCQGPRYKKDWERIIELVKKQRDHGLGTKVSYAMMRLSWMGDMDLGTQDFNAIQQLPTVKPLAWS